MPTVHNFPFQLSVLLRVNELLDKNATWYKKIISQNLNGMSFTRHITVSCYSSKAMFL